MKHNSDDYATKAKADESSRLATALERALSGDFTGHENCSSGHCDVASPVGDGPFRPGNPLRVGNVLVPMSH